MLFDIFFYIFRRRKSQADGVSDDTNPNFQRRNLSLAALSIPIVGGVLDAKQSAFAQGSTLPANSKILLSVPRDCFIKSVVVQNGANLNTGDVVVYLDTEDEDRSLARIALADQFIALQEASLSDAQIGIRLQVLQETADTADAYLKYANTMFNKTSDYFKIGQDLSVEQAAATIVRANAERNRANSAVDLFVFNTTQAKQKLSYVKDQLPTERADLMKRRERMTLKTPIQGRVAIKSYEGAFLTKGTVVAEIN